MSSAAILLGTLRVKTNEYNMTLLCYSIVKQKRSSLSQTVVSVLDEETEKLFCGKDSNTLNNDFLDRNSNSVLHRAAGEFELTIY